MSRRREYLALITRIPRPWVVIAAFLVVSLLIVGYLARPVSLAPMRLNAVAGFIGLTALSDGRLTVVVTDWELSGVQTGAAAPGGTTQKTIRRTPHASPDGFDILQMWVPKDAELLLTHVGSTTAASTYLAQLTHPSRLYIQSGSEEASYDTLAADGTWQVTPYTSELEPRMGADRKVSVRFTIQDGALEISKRFLVSRLGFGQPTDAGVRATLRSGALHFLYKPNAALQLFQGSDLRLGEVDMEISGLTLSREGIAVSADGVTHSAALVGRYASTHVSRSLMPLHYDWLMGRPWSIAFLAFAAFVTGALGLALAFLQFADRNGAPVPITRRHP